MKDFIIKSLTEIKNIQEKKSQALKLEIDILDFPDAVDIAIKAISRLLGGKEDYIDWWLYEDVNKIIYDGDEEFNVEKVEDFVEWLITGTIISTKELKYLYSLLGKGYDGFIETKKRYRIVHGYLL